MACRGEKALAVPTKAHVTTVAGESRMVNENYAVQVTPNRKGRDQESKDLQVSVYGSTPL